MVQKLFWRVGKLFWHVVQKLFWRVDNFFWEVQIGAKIILAREKIILGGAKNILAGGKMILAGGKMILAGGTIILAGLGTTRQSHPVRASEVIILKAQNDDGHLL